MHMRGCHSALSPHGPRHGGDGAGCLAAPGRWWPWCRPYGLTSLFLHTMTALEQRDRIVPSTIGVRHCKDLHRHTIDVTQPVRCEHCVDRAIHRHFAARQHEHGGGNRKDMVGMVADRKNKRHFAPASSGVHPPRQRPPLCRSAPGSGLGRRRAPAVGAGHAPPDVGGEDHLTGAGFLCERSRR